MKSIIQFTDNFAGQPVKLWPPDRRGLFSGYTNIHGDLTPRKKPHISPRNLQKKALTGPF